MSSENPQAVPAESGSSETVQASTGCVTSVRFWEGRRVIMGPISPGPGGRRGVPWAFIITATPPVGRSLPPPLGEAEAGAEPAVWDEVGEELIQNLQQTKPQCSQHVASSRRAGLRRVLGTAQSHLPPVCPAPWIGSTDLRGILDPPGPVSLRIFSLQSFLQNLGRAPC